MLLLEGNNDVVANVSGKVEDFAVPEIALVIFYFPDFSFISWAPTGVNTLLELVAGNLYTVIATEDIATSTFSPVTGAVPSTKKFVYSIESTDDNTSDLPPILLESDSLNLIKFTIVAKDATGDFKAVKEINTVISLDTAGVVTIESFTTGIIFNIDTNFTIDDSEANKIIAQVANTNSGFIGIIVWAVTIDITTVVYSPDL